MKRLFLIIVSAWICQTTEAAKTQKSFHLAWDPVTYSVSFYTVFQYSALVGDYLQIGTVLFPAPTKFAIPKGTIMGTIYMVTATDTNGLESLHSADCPLTKPPK